MAPGQSITISFAGDSEAIRTMIEGSGKTQFSNVSQMVVSFQQIYFSDGMMWWSEHYFTPDNVHPGKYTMLADTYFPGSVARTRSLQ